MNAAEKDVETCLRAGWIFHQKSTSGKTWQQKWVTLAADGTLTVADKRNSKRRGRQMYDIRRDCMYIWTAAQCQHLVPPPDLDTANLIELLLTGDRRLAFCGLSTEDSELWYKCIEAARSETELPTPRYTNANSTAALADIPEENNLWCCASCTRPSSKVKAIDYRPSTMQSTASYARRKRRVSWSKEVTMIGE